MSKIDLIIFDANVIIYLAKEKRLDNLFNVCKVFITEAMYHESGFYIDDETGERHTIDLIPYIERGDLIVLSDVEMDEEVLYKKKKAESKCGFTVDDGELEGAMFIYKNKEYRMCTGDNGAIKFLCVLGLSDNLISLEEIIGNVNYIYSKKKLKKLIKEGNVLYVQYFS